MSIALILIYSLFSLFVVFYSIVQLGLVISYLRNRKKVSEEISHYAQQPYFPHVTVQLPVYNEMYVIERLIEAVANFNYPSDKLEIQVLDDSTDETVQIISRKVKELRAAGLDISQVIRPERKGFKAGALDFGMNTCKGEYIAIFDADFVPTPNFLLDTIPYFQDEQIGVVQTRWEHINKEYSLLTRLQAFALDAHFSVEQGGRNFAGHFINFNGTAGVWRKQAIIDGGGWKADTLTEDLDLSYRAQLKGWKFIFKEEIGAPAELPAEMNALKAQQFRWTKGAAECTVKNLGKVVKHKNYSFWTKINAIFHLMNSFLFIAIFSIAMLSLPLFILKQSHIELQPFFKLATISLFSFAVIGVLYFTSFAKSYTNKGIAFLHFLYYFPLFLSFSMGLSLHNSLAVLEGYAGKKSPFVRTPKFSLTDKTGNWKGKSYSKIKVNWVTLFEGLFALYFALGVYLCFVWNDYGMLPLFAMLTLGFGVIAGYSLKHSMAR